MIALDSETRVLILTGAGVSAESGIATFRDAGGLWEQHRVEEVASPEGFAADPALVWRFYSERRRRARACEPNPGHVALAALDAALGDRCLLVTQNVDGLHRRAGQRRLVELHGHLYTTRCADCARPPFADEREYDAPPACDACGGRLRPHIVWFGEMLDADDLWRIKRFMRAAEGKRFVFLAAGTSGAVYPAASFVDDARLAGAETWLVNLEPPENAGRFEHFLAGPSGRILPGLFRLP